MQHAPHLSQTLEHLFKGRLKEASYPFLEAPGPNSSLQRWVWYIGLEAVLNIPLFLGPKMSLYSLLEELHTQKHEQYRCSTRIHRRTAPTALVCYSEGAVFITPRGMPFVTYSLPG
jgi:hypothetical protein